MTLGRTLLPGSDGGTYSKAEYRHQSSLKGASGMPPVPHNPQHDIRAWGDGQEAAQCEKTGAHCWPQATPTLPKKSGIFPLSLRFILGAPATEVAGLLPGGHLRQSTFLQFQKLPNVPRDPGGIARPGRPESTLKEIDAPDETFGSSDNQNEKSPIITLQRFCQPF
ncbi:unnamed protein product [Rangifer tarandus platyrhynchus]|uniref:Uncharacterized protein n=1 Tax=Rangifer tarandus platyrhynchus TaxID=3082113 RepID=A0ABN8ZTN2_RANTA|nr:unnamed protein product [Rangifer tarandus platyrhynchus]